MRKIFFLSAILFLPSAELHSSSITWSSELTYVNTNGVAADTYAQLIKGPVVAAKYFSYLDAIQNGGNAETYQVWDNANLRFINFAHEWPEQLGGDFGSAPIDTGVPILDRVLATGYQGGGGQGSLVITLQGLTVGKRYSIQLFSSSSYGFWVNNKTPAPEYQNFNVYYLEDPNDPNFEFHGPNTEPPLGHPYGSYPWYITGEFVADSETEIIVMYSALRDSSSPPPWGNPSINAYILTDQSTPIDSDDDGVNNYREGKDGTDPNNPNSFNPLSKGLVAYYPFDGNANDESGFSRHIETQGLDFAENRFCSEGSALALTKAFSASSTVYFDASAPRTFSQWVKVVDFPARTDPGWFKQDVPIAAFPQSVVLGNTFAADGEWWLDTGSGVAFYDFPLTTKWTQITVVYEGNVVEGKVYRNGVEVPLKSWVYPKTQFDSGDYNPLVGIAGFWNSTNTSANNLIDEVRIYDRALSSLEVKSLFYETAFTVEERSFLSASPSILGHYSLSEYNANRTNGRADVTTNPSAFNLFTQSQFDANRTAGQSDVINNPMSYGLYTSNSIMDLRMNGLMVQKNGSNAVVSFQPQTTTDLSLPFTNNGTPITNTIPMPGNKGFIRINAKP